MRRKREKTLWQSVQKAKKGIQEDEFRKRRKKANVVEFSEKNVLVCKVHKNDSSGNKIINIKLVTTENS